MKTISKTILIFFSIIVIVNIAMPIFSNLIYRHSVNKIDEINIPW